MLNFSRLIALYALALGAHNANAQSSHILMLDIDSPQSVQKISEQKFYSNQPLVTSRGVYYTQDVDGQTDLFLYQYDTKMSVNLTDTAKRSEYSPTITPDGAFISTVVVEADGTQRLWRYGLTGEAIAPIDIEQTVVGYHAWGASEQALFLFALGEPHYAAYRIDEQLVRLTDNPGRTLAYLPQTQAFSFTQEVENGQLGLYQFAPSAKQKSDEGDYSLIMELPSSAVDYTWFSSDSVLYGEGAQVYEQHAGGKPKLKFDLSSYCDGEITRLNFNASLQRLALVCKTS